MHCLSIRQSINQLTDRPTDCPISRSVGWSVSQPVSLSTHQPNNQLTYQPRVSLRTGYQANSPTTRTILPCWFDYLEESFSYKEFQVKEFCPPAKNVNETPTTYRCSCQLADRSVSQINCLFP